MDWIALKVVAIEGRKSYIACKSIETFEDYFEFEKHNKDGQDLL